MGKNLKAGESTMEGVIILAVILIIIISMPKNPNRTASVSPGSIFSTGNSPIPGSSTAGGPVIRSAPQAQYISLGTGNAAYSYQPYEEYVTIENYGREPVNITGWQLKNGKDKRAYYQGGMLQRFSADVAVVPQAARLLSPTGQNILGDVILAQGESAVVTTGSVNVQSPYKITSFKENSCTGYLEKLPDYAFTPPLSQNCPWPSKEPGIENLPPECRDIISTISSCQTPVFESRDLNREPCDNCLNGKIVPSYCAAFIKEHYSYEGCVRNHAGNANFYGRTWRIFLGRGWEMWAKDYEMVNLFNSAGQLVDFKNY